MNSTLHVTRLMDLEHLGRAYDEVLAPSFGPHDRTSRKEFLEDHIYYHTYAVGDAEQPEGIIVGEPIENTSIMLIAWLAVRPGVRGRGTGTRLLQGAMKQWNQEGYTTVLAEVEPSHKQAAHENHGNAERRLHFYARQGGKYLPVPYAHRSRHESLPGEDMLLVALLVENEAPQETFPSKLLQQYLDYLRSTTPRSRWDSRWEEAIQLSQRGPLPLCSLVRE